MIQKICKRITPNIQLKLRIPNFGLFTRIRTKIADTDSWLFMREPADLNCLPWFIVIRLNKKYLFLKNLNIYFEYITNNNYSEIFIKFTLHVSYADFSIFNSLALLTLWLLLAWFNKTLYDLNITINISVWKKRSSK